MEDDNEVDVLDIDVPISIWRSNSETDAKFLGDRLVVVWGDARRFIGGMGDEFLEDSPVGFFFDPFFFLSFLRMFPFSTEYELELNHRDSACIFLDGAEDTVVGAKAVNSS
jgi:hypothetical protein